MANKVMDRRCTCGSKLFVGSSGWVCDSCNSRIIPFDYAERRELARIKRMESCNKCEGKGVVECEECEGEGEITCHCCGSDVDCDACCGLGDVDCECAV